MAEKLTAYGSTMKFIVDRAKAISAIIGSITAIGGVVLYINSTYAHAADVEKILQNQDKQFDLFNKSQRQALVFQLEYYDEKIQKLTKEKQRAQELLNDPKTSASMKRYIRQPDEIQSEINDVKQRREIVRRSLTGN